MRADAIPVCLAAALLAASPGHAQNAPRNAATALGAQKAPGAQKLRSERGDVPIEATSGTQLFRTARDREPYARDFEQQPPLIPHTIKGYSVTRNFNKCMDCHAWSKAKETGATKVSLSHFKTREGRELSNISPRRYFCLQCHVIQVEAEPLVKNEFVPLETVKAKSR